MPDLYVFHESLDSTRAGEPPNFAQAQTEILVSLLLGQEIAIPNTYAFDSRSMLGLAGALLTTRQEVLQRLPKARPGHQRISQARPLHLTWYNAESFFSACANQLRRVPTEGEELADPEGAWSKRFKLSAWIEIDLDRDKRLSFADALSSGLDPERPHWMDDVPTLASLFESLTALERYSREFRRGRAARHNDPETIQLINYLHCFQSLDRPSLTAMANNKGCPLEFAVPLQEEIQSRFRNQALREQLNARGWAHTARDQAAAPDLPHRERMREFVDTLYNYGLAASAYAEFGFLSSVPRTGQQDDLKHVNALALDVIRSARAERGLCEQGEAPPLSGIFRIADNAPILAVDQFTTIFRTYWEILADDSLWQSWESSRAEVNLQLHQADRDPDQFEEFWSAHVSLLEENVPRVIRTDRGKLVFQGREGDLVYYHEVTQAAPSRRDLSNSLALGEYMEVLGRGANQ